MRRSYPRSTNHVSAQALLAYDTRAPRLLTGPMHLLHDAAVGMFTISGFSTIADRLENEESDASNTVNSRQANATRARGRMFVLKKFTGYVVCAQLAAPDACCSSEKI